MCVWGGGGVCVYVYMSVRMCVQEVKYVRECMMSVSLSVCL